MYNSFISIAALLPQQTVGCCHAITRGVIANFDMQATMRAGNTTLLGMGTDLLGFQLPDSPL